MNNFFIKSSLLLILLSLMTACAMPAKFKSLTAPDEGFAAIYVYKVDSKKQHSLTRNVDYSIRANQAPLRKLKLRKNTSHAHQLAPGTITFIHHAASGDEKKEIPIAAGDTLFIQLETATPKNRVQTQVLGRNISTATQHSAAIKEITDFLRSTRTQFFDGQPEGALDPKNNALASNSHIAAAHAARSRSAPASANTILVNTKPAAATPVISTPPGKQTGASQPIAIKQANTEVPSELSEPAENVALVSNKVLNKAAEKNWPGIDKLEQYETLDQYKVSCTSPVLLTQGCTRNNRTKKKIVVKHIKLKASTNDDGSVVYITGPQTAANAFAELYSLGTAVDKRNSSVELSIEPIQAIAKKHGLNLVQQIRVLRRGDLRGYIVKANGNLFELLQSPADQ